MWKNKNVVYLEFINFLIVDRCDFLERLDFLIVNDLIPIWLDHGVCVSAGENILNLHLIFYREEFDLAIVELGFL